MTHPRPASTHAVILPTYNSGPMALKTARQVHAAWGSIFIVIDGSDDGSEQELRNFAGEHPDVHLIERARNGGKGAAFLDGAEAALAAGFTHGLIIDADGQHPVDRVVPFMKLSEKHPDAMILGVPVFGPDAPIERVKGRRVGNGFAELATFGGGIRDSLFGLRVLPLAPAVTMLKRTRFARRFDFDTEIAVRLYWAGVQPINVPSPVYYPPKSSGGVTHFHYLRDNLLLVGTHTRLFFGMLARIPELCRLRKRNRTLADAYLRNPSLLDSL